MADEYDEFLARTTQQAPSAGPVPVTTGAGVDAYDEFINRSKTEPAAASAAQGTDPYDEFISRGAVPAAEPRGYLAELGHLAAGGVERNIAQWQSMPDQLLGVYHEAQGDLDKAVEYSKKAQAIQAPTGESEWSLQKIHDAETFSYWVAEKLGEQSITALAMLATGGTAGLGASALSQNLLTRGLIGQTSARAMMLAGMGVPTYALTTAMETAGTAEEQFQITGSTQPTRSIAAGATKGLLELWTPLSISRALLTPGLQLGKSLPGAIGKLAAKEAATETAQEAIDIYARQLAEPGYSYFKNGPTLAPSGWGEGMWRLAESGAAGGLVGAAFGGPAAVMERRQERRAELGDERPGFNQTVQEGRQQLPSQEVIAKDKVWIEKDGKHWTASSQFGDVFAVLDRVPGGTFALRVQSSGLNQEQFKGQGHGAALYKELFDQALAAGYPIHSDGIVSMEAAKIYESFRKFGYKVEGPFGQKQKDMAGEFYTTAVNQGVNPEVLRGQISSEAGPIYRITAAPSARMSQEVRLRIFPTANEVDKVAEQGKVKTSLMKILPGIVDNDKGYAGEEPPRGHPDRQRYLQDKMDSYSRRVGEIEAEKRRSGFQVISGGPGPVTQLHNSVVPKRPGDKLTQEVRAKDPRDDALGVGPLLVPDSSLQRQRVLDAIEAATERYVEVLEKPQAAAIRIKEHVFTGVIHADAFEAANNKLGKGVVDKELSKIESGYVTTSGRFLSKDEAATAFGTTSSYGVNAGQLSSRIWTNTEWELENATNRKQSEKPRLLKVNQQTLQPGAITAHISDLPEAGSERIWFLPGVSPAEKQQLLQNYAALQQEAVKARNVALNNPLMRNVMEENFKPLYDELLTAGLRVIPSHGSGFYYNGVVEGEEVKDLKSTGRSSDIMFYHSDLNIVTPFTKVDKIADGWIPVSVDVNKLQEGDIVPTDDGRSFRLKRPLDLNKITPGIVPMLDQQKDLLSAPVGFMDKLSKTTVIVMGVKSENGDLARRMQVVLNALAPTIDQVLKSIGINQPLGIQITDNVPPGADGTPSRTPAWIWVNSGMIGISPQNWEGMFLLEDLERKLLGAVMHEVGHAVTYWYYRNLPVGMQDKLQYAWEKGRLSFRMGDTSRLSHPLQAPNIGLVTQAKWDTFSEWLAEQFRRWGTSNSEPKSWLDKTYQEGGKQLEKYYRQWEQKFGEKQAANLAEPDYYFSGVMDYLRGFSREKQSFEQLLKRDALYTAGQSLLDSPVKFQILKQADLALRSLQDIALPGQMVRINEFLDPKLTPTGDAPSHSAGGRFIPSASKTELGLIELAVGSLKPESALDTVKGWYTHETWHSYENTGIVTPEEIEILMRDIRGQEDKLFPKADRLQLQARVAKYGEIQGWTKEQILAEYQRIRDGEYRAYYMMDAKPALSEEGGRIKAFFHALMERLANFFNGLGFQTKEDVLRAFFKGEMVARYEARLEQNAVEGWQVEQMPSQEALVVPTKNVKTIKEAVTGKPIELILYHGAAQAAGQYTMRNTAVGEGPTEDLRAFPPTTNSIARIWYSDDPEIAHRYTQYHGTDNPAIFRHVVTIKNPLVYDGEGRSFPWITKPENKEMFNVQEAQIKKAKQNGHDAVIFRNVLDIGGVQNQVAVLDTTLSRPQRPSQEVIARDDQQVKTVEVEPGVMMRVVYYEGKEQRNAKGRLYNAAIHYLFTQGDILIGSASLKNRGDRGFEISNVSAQAEKVGRLGFLNGMMKHIAQDVGIPLWNPADPQNQLAKPAGRLTQGAMPGYKFAFRGTEQAEWLKLYVYDKNTGVYYSPNNILKSRAYWNLEKARSKRGESRHNPQIIADWLTFFNGLYTKVPTATWQDPRLRQMFVLDRNSKRDEVQGALIRAGQQVEESKLLASLGYGSPMQDVFQSTFEMKQAFSQAENARISRLPVEMSAPSGALTFEVRRTWEKLTGYGESAEARRSILNTLHEADRIGKYSKYAWTLDQLAWSNEHILPLRELIQHKEQMNALMNSWLRRADETAREWRKISDPKRKAGITDALFGLMEMRYRLPVEVAAKVVRMPSNWVDFLTGQQAIPNGELDRFFKKAGLDPRDQAIVRRVAGDFQAFLADVETVRVKILTHTLANSPQALQVALADLTKEMAEIRQKPYFPMMRWGEFTVRVRDAQTKEVLEFQAFGTQSQRDAAVPEMKRKYPAADIQIGRVASSSAEFMSLPSPLLKTIKEKLFDKTGKNADQVALIDQQIADIEEFEMANSPDRTFRKRWMPAHGIPGYNTDAFRAYASYFQYGSRYLARLAYMDELYGDLAALQKSKDGLGNTAKREAIIKYVRDWIHYILEPGRDSGKFRALVSMWYLGFSPAAAAMNFTQTVTTTFPTLQSHFGAAAVKSTLVATTTGMKNVWRNPTGSTAYVKAREEMVQQGFIDVGQAPELAAFAEGYNLHRLQAVSKTQDVWRGALNWGMKMFSIAEQVNREIAFKASWDLAMKYPQTKRLLEIDALYPIEVAELQARVGLSHQEAIAFMFAKEMIKKTQFVYDKTSDAPFMRGKAKDFLIFFKYTQSMLYAFGNNGAMLQMLLIFAFLYGLNGLPGAEDAAAIVDMLDAIGRWAFGKDFHLRSKAREFFVEATKGTPFEKTGPDLALHGISRYGFGMSALPSPFAPQFDASSNGSMGRIIPGFAEYMHGLATGKKFADVFADAAQKSAGAGYGSLFGVMQLLHEGPSADSKKWESALLPRFLKAEAKAWRYGVDPKAETTRSGAKLPSARFDAGDPDDLATVLAQAFGFQPRKVSQTWELIRASREEEEIYRGRRTALYVQMDKAVTEGSKAAIDDVTDAVTRYNNDVGKLDPMMQIDLRQLRASLKQRQMQRAMTEQTLSANKRQMLLTDRLKELYPGVTMEKVK